MHNMILENAHKTKVKETQRLSGFRKTNVSRFGNSSITPNLPTLVPHGNKENNVCLHFWLFIK